MSFASDLSRFAVKVTARSKHVVAAMVADVQESIVDGSPVTGAPGQPVDTGALKNSWQGVVDPSGWSGTVGTNLVYAPIIEEGMMVARTGQVTGATGQRLTLRSRVGGFHSVKLTVANADRLQAAIVAGMR